MKKNNSEKKDSEKSEETPSSSKKKNFVTSKIIKDLSKNYWAISTIVLAVLLIASVLSGGLTGAAVVSPETAGQNVLDFAIGQGAVAELISTTDDGSLYEVILSITGEDGIPQEVPVYVTKDGQTLVPQPIPLTAQAEATTTPSTPEATEIPKSDNPTVGLYIWSYCPYGVTALEPFANVASLLGGDFKVFLYYAGHGDFEIQQNKIQACIQKLDKEKYWDYSKGFASDIYTKCSGDIECDLTESTKLMDSLGIDSTAVMSCVETSGEALTEADFNSAKEVGVTGSPSLVINGVKANVARTAEAYKSAICSAYNEAPATCEETLDSTAATTTGSC